MTRRCCWKKKVLLPFGIEPAGGYEFPNLAMVSLFEKYLQILRPMTAFEW